MIELSSLLVEPTLYGGVALGASIRPLIKGVRFIADSLMVLTFLVGAAVWLYKGSRWIYRWGRHRLANNNTTPIDTSSPSDRSEVQQHE
jgi:hypothetical protein